MVMGALPRYILNSLIGFIIGLFVLHPFSMVFGEVDQRIIINMEGLRHAFSSEHSMMAVFFGMLGALIGIGFTITHLMIREEKEHIHKLEGVLPICSKCKMIRDERGAWVKLEKYINERSPVDFSHGLCPGCLDEVYPGLKGID